MFVSAAFKGDVPAAVAGDEKMGTKEVAATWSDMDDAQKEVYSTIAADAGANDA